MGKKEFDSLGYLSKVFKGLSVEKKDHVLITARLLLRIQNNSTLPMIARKDDDVPFLIDEDDIPYMTNEDMTALEAFRNVNMENFDWDIGESEAEAVLFSDTPAAPVASVYHLLLLDRLYSPLNSDISGTDGILILYKYKHGRNGYLIALYKSAAGETVFPQLPDKSHVLADFTSERLNDIREYIRSSEFRMFVTNSRVISDMDAVLLRE